MLQGPHTRGIKQHICLLTSGSQGSKVQLGLGLAPMGFAQAPQSMMDKSLGHHSTHKCLRQYYIPSNQSSLEQYSRTPGRNQKHSGLEPGDPWELLACLSIYIFYTWLTWRGVSQVSSSLNVGQMACGPLTWTRATSVSSGQVLHWGPCMAFSDFLFKLGAAGWEDCAES